MTFSCRVRLAAAVAAVLAACGLVVGGGAAFAANPPVVPLTGVSAIAAGYNHTCAVMAGGGVKCWGASYFGSLGEGTTSASYGRLTPVDVVGLASGVSSVEVGGSHTCVLTSGGGVTCWGSNARGQLGDGTGLSSLTPVSVSGLGSGVLAVSGLGDRVCAVVSGGAVKCWGPARWLDPWGSPPVPDNMAPVDESGLGSGVAALSVSPYFACVVTNAGGVKCWGTTPVDVAGLGTGVKAVTTGFDHSCALLVGGGVKCWGSNWAGELGDGTTTNRTTPVDVVGLGTGVQAVSAGIAHTCALLTGGGVKCWGSAGTLGNGSSHPDNSPTPVDVTGLTSGVAAISAGGSQTCALLVGGGVKCWGDNSVGQLGDGTNIDRTTPVDVLVVAPPYDIGLPGVVGTPAVGASLVADAGMWSGEQSFAYQWLVDGVEVTGATGTTYVPGPGDIGKRVSVRVTATGPGGSASAVSGQSSPVAAVAANLVPDPDVEIYPFGFYYTNGAAAFSWATDAWRSPAPWTYGSSGHALKIVSSTGGGALARWMTQTQLIPVSPGKQYTASVFLKTSGVVQSAGLAVSFWTAGLAYTGTTVSSAESLSGSHDWSPLALTARAPAGADYLRVEVRLYGAGTVWADDLSVSGEAPPPPVSTGAPSIAGSAIAGNVLTASPGQWTDDPAFTYQWQVDGTDIPGATSVTYLLGAADAGREIGVRVTATGPGGSASAVSAPVGPVIPRTTPQLAPDPNLEVDPSAFYYTNGTATFSWATDAAHSQAHSLKLVSTQPAGTMTRWMTRIPLIPVTPGSQYTTTAYMKTQDARAGTELVVTFWDAGQNYIANSAWPAYAWPSDWQEATVIATAPPTAAFMRLEFRLNGSGTLWVDDVAVTG